MRIAVVGSGISGLACALTLAREHEITLYEANNTLGGHANTVRVHHEGRDIDVDTGFIVYNDRNYPLLTRFFETLGIEGTDAPMTFGVRDDTTGLEYGGESLRTMLAQKCNALRPSFWLMIRDVLRFFEHAPKQIKQADDDITLGAFIERFGYSRRMRDRFLVPMGGAIWSSSHEQMLAFPMKFFVAFYQNHGMLTLKDRPQWRTVPGGSRRYVDAVADRLGERVRLSSPVRAVRRTGEHVEVVLDDQTEMHDHVVLACHSDQALALLDDAGDDERRILGAIPYQPNDTVLHWDSSVMPRKRAAWSAWNARVRPGSGNVVVTYDLTTLQSLPTKKHLLVSLNQTDEIDPKKIYRRFTYDHPVFTTLGEHAKAAHATISGTDRTHFAGAYWFNGFHEDGIRSAQRVCAALGSEP